MKVDIVKPKLKKLYQALKDKKPKDEFQLARTNLSSDALEQYVLMKLKEADAKRKP
jgi:tRNA nucleotidyltransferase (CCA-adding enzyme)